MRIELKKLRIDTRMNQKNFAEKIGVSSQSYSKMERGEIDGSLATWFKIQENFNIPDSEMFKLMKNV